MRSHRLATTVRATSVHVVALVAASLLTGALWMVVVPPFEGTDELYFYNRARQFAHQPEGREAIFFRLAAPLVRAFSPDIGSAYPEYNPAFQYVGNARGLVNRFAHDRRVAPHEHVRALLAVRGLVVALSALTVLVIYAIARLTLADPELALLVAGISLWIPQVSFVDAMVHTEVVTRLITAATTLVIVARTVGVLPRAAAWLLLPLCMAIAPLGDRQAFFVAPFAALGLVATERTWPGRAAAAALVLVPAAIAVWLVAGYTELGTDLSPWIALIRHPLLPFGPADPGRGLAGVSAAYYLYEFAPKVFMGFWGWLGQPSILLPAWAYAVFAVVTIVAGTGLLLRLRHLAPVDDDERRRRTARRLMAAGIVMMCVPIIYGPAIAGRNLWYGRWLFAMLGPIVIGLVLGIREFALVSRRWPRHVAVATAVVAASGLALWATGPGEAVRAAI